MSKKKKPTVDGKLVGRVRTLYVTHDDAELHFQLAGKSKTISGITFKTRSTAISNLVSTAFVGGLKLHIEVMAASVGSTQVVTAARLGPSLAKVETSPKKAEPKLPEPKSAG